MEDDDPTLHEGGTRGLPASVPIALAGRTVSHFRVGVLLGGGGMGVVHRAEDLHLGRPVALKFLAPELVRDPIGKARFLKEARAASALDHPNLCTVLEVGETEEGLLFLAMPCYEGESLEARLLRGPLPVDEAVDVAAQAARGLAKAHQAGIVHRDVKPGNLFLTEDGVVKILDFGIAKLAGEAGPTRHGVLLGTPSYMAPELTRGEEVDARADVWALGVVLYEMLAGRRPFTGGTGTAVLHAVLHRSPEPLSELRPEVPAEIRRIVDRLLSKDPGERYADAGEALAALRQAQGLPATTTLSGPLSLPPPRRSWRSRRAVAALLGLALAGGAAVVGLLAWRRGSATTALELTGFTHLTDAPGVETSPSLSPDGRFFVYAKAVSGKFGLFLQRVGGGNPIDLSANSPADDLEPAFSPDGAQIAFRSEREGGGLFIMGATGESVRRLTDFGFNPAWSPDGRQIAFATEGAFDPASRYSQSQLYLLDLATGGKTRLEVPDAVQPAWSPHGFRIAFWGLAQPGGRRAIWTLPAGGGTPVQVVEDAYTNWSPAWFPDGRYLYFASDRGGSMNLWRVAIDERTGEVSGAPQPITTPSVWSALPTFSKDGRLLLYATSDHRSLVEEVPFDPGAGRVAGAPRILFQGARAIYSCDLSPDGNWLALESDSPQEDLLLLKRAGGDLRQLTNDPARDRGPRWSPDGRQILFSSSRSGKYEAWTIRPDGSGLSQLTHAQEPVGDPAWSPDGRRIAFTAGARGTGILDLADLGKPAAKAQVLPPAADGQVLGRVSWSPDGGSLAGMLLQKDGSPTPGVVLWSLADNTHRRLTSSGETPVFFHDGTRILYTSPEAISAVDKAGREARTLLTAPPHSTYVAASVGQDDRVLCTVRTTNEGDIWSLKLPGVSGSSPQPGGGT